ncbi:MAG: hypothetical protein ACXAE3_05540 [Candidatus Kariarchaeaceae archaeon]
MQEEIDKEIAAGNYEKAVILHFRWARSLQADDPERALGIFSKALEYGERELPASNSHLDHLYYATSSLLFHDLARFDEAYDMYERGRKWANNNQVLGRDVFYIDHLAMVRLHQFQFDDALQLLDEVDGWLVENKKREIDFYFHRMLKGWCLLRLDIPDAAMRCILSVLPVPMEDPMTNMLLYTLLFRLLYEQPETLTDERAAELIENTPLQEVTLTAVIRHMTSMYNPEQHDPAVRYNLELARYAHTTGQEYREYLAAAQAVAGSTPRKLIHYLTEHYY